MAVRIVRLGSARASHEGLRLGTVRRPPRGVRKEDWSKRDFYDVWVPDLAPTPALVGKALAGDLTDAQWAKFVRAYRKEMREPVPRRLIELLAAFSRTADFSVGCYCADESRCHRGVLRALLEEAGAEVR